MSFGKTFELDTSVLLPGSATKVTLGATTSSDVLKAVAKNESFPDRQIDLANIGLTLGGGIGVGFQVGAGQISLGASADAALQVGVFDDGSEVLARLSLEDAEEVGLTFTAQPETRYMLFLAGYSVRGEASGSHPIGVLGSVTFGVEGRRAHRYAVVHRFRRDAGAHDVFRETFASVRLPRHVTDASAISDATHLIAEVDGSVAVSLGARLGYDFSFIRDSRLTGLQGDVGLKLETGLKAAIGLDVSGRYLLVLERPSREDSIRLRLFKLRKKGLTFGLNLSVKVQAVTDLLPENVDDLVKAVFGVHGQQVIKDLHAIEQWTDPALDLSDTVAGLTNKTGLALLKDATGLDPKAAFDKARARVLAAIKKWEELPSTVSALLWSEMERGGLSGDARQKLESSLRLLAAPDDETRKQEVVRLLSAAGIEDDLTGRLLTAAADQGLAALLGQSAGLGRVAATVLEVLNGGVIEKLQRVVAERLSLDQLLTVANETDFDSLDDWLVQRLSRFFDQALRFEDLDKVKDAIHLILGKRQEIYEKARQALAHRYDFDFAYRYQRATSKTALIDATFDTTRADAQAMLAAIVQHANLDRLLTTPTDGVSLNTGVLTHEIARSSAIEVSLPYYDAKATTLANSFAQVRAQEDGGRVLFYELAASETITRNRLRSQLAMSASMPVRPGSGLRVHDVASASWSYRFLQIAPDLRRKELEERIAPLALQYFPHHFPGGVATLSGFLTDFDRAVEEVVNNGTDEFGDLLLSLDVSIQGRAMAAWIRPRTRDQARADARAASLRIQKSLQQLIPFYFFRDLNRLRQNMEASPLLVFSALPRLNDFALVGDRIVEQKGPIWDVFDPALRAHVVGMIATKGTLGAILASQRARLLAAGRSDQARFFEPHEIGDFMSGVSDHPNFVNLLRLTSVAARGAEEAVNDLRGFEADAEKHPTKAIERLAEFGVDVVSTFNRHLSSVYGGDLLRPLGSLVFLEAACALDPAIGRTGPSALLSMTVLKERRTYRMEDFLANEMPPPDQVAVRQRLVSA